MVFFFVCLLNWVFFLAMSRFFRFSEWISISDQKKKKPTNDISYISLCTQLIKHYHHAQLGSVLFNVFTYIFIQTDRSMRVLYFYRMCSYTHLINNIQKARRKLSCWLDESIRLHKHVTCIYWSRRIIVYGMNRISLRWNDLINTITLLIPFDKRNNVGAKN